MTRGLTITKPAHFHRMQRGRKVVTEGEAPKTESLGRVPRVSRLMALAIQMQGWVDNGEVTDYADLARLAHVSRAQITQIMNLLHLSPDIQEAILFLPRTNGHRSPIRERMIRPIAATLDWHEQREMWSKLTLS